MNSIETMSLEELEAAKAQIRERVRELKKTGKAAERKILTLVRRRERFMDKVREVDAQIEELRRQASIEPAPAPRRRGRRPKSAAV